jgi:predicted  nucleic acid-binding Zn-ribbon protein
MERKSIWALFCVVGLYLFTPQQAYAQSNATSAENKPTQDQVIREILSEVRELRTEVQRLKASLYQAQVATGRLRLQQEQVSRLKREISEVREKIIETQARQVKLNGMIDETQKKVDAGVINPSELKKINGEIEELKQREQRLIDQENELSTELNAESAKLTTLNKQLDELGQEAAGAEKK